MIKKIKIIWTLCLFLIVSINSNLSAQLSQFDSIRLKEIAQNVELLEKFRIDWRNQKQNLENLARDFCFLNDYDNHLASKVLNIFLSSDLFETTIRHKFLITNAHCFTSAHRGQVRQILKVELKYTDYYYHELIIAFKIGSEMVYLRNNISDSLFQKIRIDIRKREKINENIQELRNLAALSQLNESLEDNFIEEINNLYDYFKSSDNLEFFYQNILRNSLALLNSKKSVYKTLYMIDEIELSQSEKMEDVVDMSFAYSYFFTVVQPKIKNFNIELLAVGDLKANKDEIKNIILNDNSIWKDHIN